MNAANSTAGNPGSKLTVGFSPCPNDTFMFDAMVHHKIDTEGLLFDVIIDDVESLNQKVLSNEIDVSKSSFATFFRVTDTYLLLNAGAALGNGVGPLLIAKNEIRIPITIGTKSEIGNLKIAIPGKNTTANFLFSIFFPEAVNKVEMIFSEVEDAVLSGSVDAGVIIHENRFTYHDKGLKKICDLGELWENETGQPIPLGGIIVKKSLPSDIRKKLGRVMRKSVEYAFTHPESSYAFVKQHAQEMDEAIRKKHIALYVNNYSIDLGETGRRAVETLFSKAIETGMIASTQKNIFVNQVTKSLRYEL